MRKRLTKYPILLKVLQSLLPREEIIIKHRFAIYGCPFQTLQQLGERFDVGKERIRQIEAKALRKLRHPSRSKFISNCNIAKEDLGYFELINCLFGK